MGEYIKQLEMSKNVNSSQFSPFVQQSFPQNTTSNTNTAELEELKEKCNSMYNEIQRYKVTIELQKSSIEKLKKASIAEPAEKHVKFQQNPYVVFG
jgi:FtsZ-binding cell division protein ZapB